MYIEVRRSFTRELNRVCDDSLRARVQDKINKIEAANSLSKVTWAKSVGLDRRAYRIRVGTYWMGIFVRGDRVTLVRFQHRRETYRNFP